MGIGGGREEILVLGAPVEWDKNPGVAKAEYRPTLRGYSQSEYAASQMPGKTMTESPGRGVTMSTLIQARQTIAQVATSRGLIPAVPTEEEYRQGWTEKWSGHGGQIALRERHDGKRLEVKIREGHREGALTLRQELTARLGV